MIVFFLLGLFILGLILYFILRPSSSTKIFISRSVCSETDCEKQGISKARYLIDGQEVVIDESCQPLCAGLEWKVKVGTCEPFDPEDPCSKGGLGQIKTTKTCKHTGRPGLNLCTDKNQTYQHNDSIILSEPCQLNC